MAHAAAIPLVPVKAPASGRIFFIDNLRWVMIVLVITMHAAVTYSSMGRWYYVERTPLGVGSRLFFATYQVWLQAFFMGFLFFIAGYFVPAAFDRKSAGRFLRDRAVRLGLPSLLYMALIGPSNSYFLLGGRNRGRSFMHFMGETGPLWFCVALLIFCMVYAGVRTVRRDGKSDPWLPQNRHVLLMMAAIATATFFVRTVQPIGTAVWNMQLCFFSQYVLLFAAGLHAYRHGWLERMPHELGTRWLAVSLVGGAVIWFAIMILATRMRWQTQSFDGGWHWQSVLLSAWESFFCVGVCLGWIVVFRERFNSQGRFARFLSNNAFGVYVFHPPIVIGISLLLREWAAAPVAKFAIVSAAATVITFGAAAMLRQVPVLKRIL